jgi:hypothetical protein
MSLYSEEWSQVRFAMCRTSPTASRHPGLLEPAMIGRRLLLLAGLLGACGSAERPPDTELYVMVLEAARRELALPRDMAIHPLLAQWGSGTELYAPLREFNSFDTVSVRQIVKSDTAYTACAPTVAGSCKLGRGEVAVVLSELKDIGANGIAVRVMVIDGRTGQPFQRHYFARMTNGLSGWSVVEFREVPR